MTSTTADEPGILGSSAVMAVGTVVSRLSGLVRGALLVAAIGAQLHADVFTIANTIPNMLYILLAGGVFNAVLVPQLVRAMKHDADEGEGYTNRVITLAGLFLAGVTVVLVVAAPLLMHLFLDGSYFTPELAAQRESAIAFARYCLPQVFFYGMFVLVGQVLNTRGSFGPMMWAPIANNLVSVAVLGSYLAVFGPAYHAQRCAGYSNGQELLLGIGSTVGIAVQLAVLVPYLRRAGFRFRPRFDFRGTGLGHTLRLGVWTVLFVVVNQVAFTVVVHIASSGTATAAAAGACASASTHGTGFTVYSNAYLLIMVPHSVVTVSLATAMLPQLSARAADADLAGVARTVASSLRTSYALIVPFVLLLPVIALDLCAITLGYGAARRSIDDFASSLVLFGPGLVLFTTHYLMLRGFYALERNRLVFWVQCAVAATNIALAIVLTDLSSAADTSPGLVLAFAGSYVVGAVLSYLLLRRALGGLETPRLLRFGARVVPAAALAALAAWAAKYGLGLAWAPPAGKWHSLAVLVLAGVVDLTVFVALARLLRITEVSGITALVTTRLRRA
ncbi:MAG TPA: murein biosynthesis integral membrane protein MurJ [Nocardioidaceae bacterium]|nr:murein biosynthesis integral membrane protein MurJ [Nocardioidaceae bacterium]